MAKSDEKKPQNKDLANVPNIDDASWNSIIDDLVEQLSGEDLPEDVVKVTEYLLAGYPMYEAAKKVGTTTQTIRNWISRYPIIAQVLATKRDTLIKWRMGVIEQQFLKAAQRSMDILDIDLNDKDVNTRVAAVVAAQSRYIMGLLAGQKIDISVTHELGQTVLNGNQQALDYISQQLANQRENAEDEPIEGIVRIIDSRSEINIPELDEEGNPPFGELGKFDVNDDGIQCHMCGKRYKSLSKHLLTGHHLQVSEYEMVYLLDEGSVRAIANET